ncbi:MAG: TIGR03546 family protein [Planctomycetota bacterium]
MLSLLLRPLRNAALVLLANDSSRQIAAGVAIGMVLGLVPKGNLIAVALGVALFGLKVNRSAGLLSAAAFSWMGAATDGFTHNLGAKALAVDGMQSTYAWLYELPLGPWIGFNNTVVLGSLLLGLYASYPCYLAAKLLLDRFQTPIAAWLKRRRVTRWLLGADLTTRFGTPLGIGVGS